MPIRKLEIPEILAASDGILKDTSNLIKKTKTLIALHDKHKQLKEADLTDNGDLTVFQEITACILEDREAAFDFR